MRIAIERLTIGWRDGRIESKQLSKKFKHFQTLCIKIMKKRKTNTKKFLKILSFTPNI